MIEIADDDLDYCIQELRELYDTMCESDEWMVGQHSAFFDGYARALYDALLITETQYRWCYVEAINACAVFAEPHGKNESAPWEN